MSKKWLLVALDRWSSYTVTIVWEFAWADSPLVVLDEWSSYRSGRLNRFDCIVTDRQPDRQTDGETNRWARVISQDAANKLLSYNKKLSM